MSRSINRYVTQQRINVINKRCFQSRSIKPTPRQLSLQSRLKGEKLTNYYAIGSCEFGQIGNGHKQYLANQPEEMSHLNVLDVSKLVVGHNHSIAILGDGSCVSWGFNQAGQLGQGHREPSNDPRRVVGMEGHTVDHVACGPLQSFFASTNKRTGKQAIWHCGSAYADERAEDKFTRHTAAPRKTKKVDFLGRTRIRKMVAASDFAFFISEANEIYCFGNNSDHMGVGNGFGKRLEQQEIVEGPMLIPKLEEIQIQDVAVGWGHAVALTADGELYSWGSNRHGQCGVDRINETINEPRLIEPLKGVDITQIASGETHTVALDKNGNVYTWGSHKEGKLGIGQVTKDYISPVLLEGLNGKNITKIRCGTDHTAAMSDDGNIWLWGFGQHGSMGLVTDMRNAWEPVQLPPPKFYDPDDVQAELVANEKRKRSMSGGLLQSEDPSNQPQFKIAGQDVTPDVLLGMDLTILQLESNPRKGELPLKYGEIIVPSSDYETQEEIEKREE